ncbi:MAG: ATP-binding protein [Oceanospirillaceae bacterium]
MSKRMKAVYLISTLMILIALTALVFDLFKIQQLQGIQKRDAKVSLVWFLTQTDRESIAFLQNVSDFYIGNNNYSKQKMLTSFDILWSRYDSNLNGQIELLIKSIRSGPEIVTKTRNSLKILDPLVQFLQSGNKRDFLEINRLMKENLQRSYELAINALQVRQQERNKRLDAINGLYMHLLFTLFALLCGVGIAIGLFVKNSKELKHQNAIFELRVQERTEQLKQSNESLLIEVQVRKQTDYKAQQLISAFDQSNEVVFILDSNNNFIFYNESFLRINPSINSLIKIGSCFDDYLRLVIAQNTELNKVEKKQWVERWLEGLDKSDSYFEVNFDNSVQFIFNIDQLDDGSVISIGADISALKESQKALKASESRFRNFALIGADWYWEMDQGLALTFLAGGVESVSGYPPVFFMGKSREEAYGIVGKANQRSLQIFWDKTDNEESFHEYETKWKRKDGQIITISLCGEPRYNDAGDFIGYIGAGRDVTARCLVEERDKRLLTAINSLNLMISIYDSADNLVFYNQEFDYFKNKLNGNIELGIGFNRVWQLSCDYYAQEFGFDASYWYKARLSVHRNPVNNFVLPVGSDKYINVFEKMLDDGGVIIVSTDISSSKKAEQEIHQLRNYLANIIDSMSSILIAVDAQCRVLQWNIAAQNETGISLNQAYQQPLVSVFPRLEIELDNVKAAISNGKETSQLKRLFIEEGRACYEDIIIYPLIRNEEAGAVIRLDNVTDQVLISEVMIQSEKMLSVGGLAAGMAHEINNPLAGMMQTANVMTNRLCGGHIQGNIDAANDAGISIQAIEQYMQQRGILRMLQNITESGKRVALIVENMLDFSRQNGAIASEQDLAKLFDKALELSATDHNLKYNYDFKNIGIIKEYEDSMPFIMCEPGKMQQVFLNILRNAAQAMQEAGIECPTIIVRLKFDGATQQAVIEIEDNGPGIADDVKRRVFEPFFSTKKVGLGTGLGLSVSYFIITENHGGKLSVDSILGKCTKFEVRLPRTGVDSINKEYH